MCLRDDTGVPAALSVAFFQQLLPADTTDTGFFGLNLFFEDPLQGFASALELRPAGFENGVLFEELILDVVREFSSTILNLLLSENHRTFCFVPYPRA